MEFEPKNSKPIDYVKSKIEKSEYIRFDKDKYLKPLFEYDSYMESGSIKGKIGQSEIDLDYTQDDRKISNPNIRKLERFILKNDKTKLDVLGLLSSDYSTYITTNIDKEDTSFGSVNRPRERKIYVNTPLLSVDGIMSLLHEIGHNNRDKQQSISEQNKDENSLLRFKVSGIVEKILAGMSLRGPNIKDASRVLRDERDSWSFALQKIRPFMKDLNINIEDMENIIHHDALYSYSWLIKDDVKLE
ncbi:MAG: hypothetical protein KBC42_01215 [Candidatus Pacebacteria bacterium]|nr:hypothetical protein [Candidatus Paceibacterota bacterium]MBP9780525.1 hypothetical protein [Candidatus Paceibacterota bacterium]